MEGPTLIKHKSNDAYLTSSLIDIQGMRGSLIVTNYFQQLSNNYVCPLYEIYFCKTVLVSRNSPPIIESPYYPTFLRGVCFSVK